MYVCVRESERERAVKENKKCENGNERVCVRLLERQADRKTGR